MTGRKELREGRREGRRRVYLQAVGGEGDCALVIDGQACSE